MGDFCLHRVFDWSVMSDEMFEQCLAALLGVVIAIAIMAVVIGVL